MTVGQTIVVIYGAVSLGLGGAAITHEIWSRPVMLDRATGGKHAAPKLDTVGDLAGFGLFVALVWPLIVVVSGLDWWRSTR